MKVAIFHDFPSQAMQLRETVFVQEQGFRDEFDQIDARAAHLLLFAQDRTPVGVCRVYEDPENQCYILGRLAVLKAYRKQQLGSFLVREAEAYVRGRGGREIRLHAQCRAAEFYKKQGFIPSGEIEYEESCPHIWMRKML